MGRAKLKLHKLDGSNRIGVYSRRKKGLLKKANELSVLCDIDIFLAMLSPGGKPSVYKSENSSFEDMITKIAEVNPEERAKRKMECLETIKKACKKSDHDVNIGEHLSPGDLTTEDIHFLSHSLRVRLSDIEDRLRLWKNLDKIDNIQQLRKLEDSISKSLNEIAKHKYGMGSLIFCAGEDIQPSPVQHGMDLPSNFDAGKEPHPCSSLHCCDSEIMDAYEDLSSFDSSLLNDTGQDFQASSLMQHGMNEWQDLYQCSSIHGGVDVYPVGFLEEPSFSFESYTNLVGNKEIEVSKPESQKFVPDEVFLDCELNQEDIETEFGFTFDVPQVELLDDQGIFFYCSTDNSSRLPQSHFVNIHDSSKSASGTCDNMMLEDSLNFLYGTDSLYSSIKHGTNSLSTHLNVSLAVYAGGDCENMDGYDDLNVFDSSLKFDEKQEFQSSSPIQYGMNSPVSFDAGQEGNRFSSVQGGDSESNNGYEDLNSFVQGLLEDPCLSFESYTDIACDHEIETFKPGCENCSADKMFLDCQINQEDLEMAFRSTLDLPLVEKMDAQESTFDCLNKGFGLPQLTSIIV
ncbi:uncharacterized protein LOC132643893 isoform X1 [Lycium barbarum]|uniref:uncharacterized protein LOC132643893 isoform X1 n=1 Tax=Lycium barbarum TaxID=112863 RepID=UPI00293EAB2E|nr:uncharacterized protein LOC132643893 isoform X1 [Lycium barbarum]XP_060216404.1 uncharacterized protein LOC132643893 isoform X1 [Lycium barbarum]XP_060216405.1 uncharacterized protein LOC132643893 isoform X1 [Lycium barbarum]XP_060216407.1 uncharacterized protein LOC132643893 isoform X1 [Lycium barbarum]XP_060216408.1 uncharacterized protein LOC132643893 isoform X1 [Lycium barbarum]XP_060216409.1 uncharacterized protein LOC132643893 isoform X1 [Lycium barbarum]XP_060216410.1 uncharacterize